MNTTARIKKQSKQFEIIVDMEKALAFKQGRNTGDFLEIDRIFSDSKKGFVASESDLEKVFGTKDANEIAKRIIKEGEILISQEYRDKQQEKKINQIVDFLSRNSINPQNGNPHTPERIKNALKEANVNIRNVPIEEQINEIVEKISKVIPIKLETKKVKIVIPAVHTGKAYGIINQYKIDENWLSDGSLQVIVNVPVGIIMDFYDKLNSITHGSATTEEIREND
ncbi:ribosome assembly factor SBDS [Candidatus Pacearchaeota archaeon]|nr:MAG: ribosome assembly factor SBDS [Candidatus Pacearchaeota archaeon]